MPITALLQPLKVGRYTIRNRFVMAALTRCRADENHVPTPAMVKYYSDRASMGLILTEATQIREGYSTFAYEGGIYNEKQIEGWRSVTDAVHAKGGIIFCQIHHGGRATVPSNLLTGLKVCSASEEGIKNHQCLANFNRDGKKQPFPQSVHPLTESEIKEHVQLYATAAKNAIRAGFDGVEVHGANGYLIDQFLRSSSNKRTDKYGGSIENRCRFLFEVVDAVVEAIGADRVGLRISPLNAFNDQSDDNPCELTEYLCTHLSSRNLAFLDVLRGDFFSDTTGADIWARKAYKGVMFSGMGFDIPEAEKAVEENKADAICFGVKAIANPDLVERAQSGAALNEPRPELFYTHGEEGYNDYGMMA